MPVKVKLFASLRIGRFDMEDRLYNPGLTCKEVVEKIGIPENEVRLIFINGRHASLGDQLADGDTLALFPPIGGG
jgi:sulfur-carrier protein